MRRRCTTASVVVQYVVLDWLLTAGTLATGDTGDVVPLTTAVTDMCVWPLSEVGAVPSRALVCFVVTINTTFFLTHDFTVVGVAIKSNQIT